MDSGDAEVTKKNDVNKSHKITFYLAVLPFPAKAEVIVLCCFKLKTFLPDSFMTKTECRTYIAADTLKKDCGTFLEKNKVIRSLYIKPQTTKIALFINTTISL